MSLVDILSDIKKWKGVRGNNFLEGNTNKIKTGSKVGISTGKVC